MPRRRKYESSSDELSDASSSEDDSRRRYSRGYEKKFKRAGYRPKYTLKHAPAKQERSLTGGGQGVYVLYNPTTRTRYVGKSNNVDSRIDQHQQAEGCLVREKPVTTGSASDLESWERNEVLTRMYRHGMDSVRGWRYTSRGALTMEERVSARDDIMEKFDLCRRCGRNTHFADTCFAKSPAFWCQDIPM
jgi:hypothetical protein